MFNLKITTMKKLITSLCLLVLIGISVNVMGQDATHKLGEQHTFSVTDNTSSTFVWKIFSDAGFATEVTAGLSTFAISGTNTSASFTVTWQPSLTAGRYWVRVQETATNGCSTFRNTEVQVDANNYDIIVENKRPTSATDGSLIQVDCMAGAERTFTKTAAIDKKDNILYFNVTLNDGASPYTRDAWKLSMVLTVKDKNTTPNNFTPTSISLLDASNATLSLGATLSANVAASEFSVPKGTGSFFVKVVVPDNFNTTALSNLDINLTTSELKVGAGAAGQATGASGADLYTYTRKSYPNTTNILIDGL